ncbi:uncharacterized protein LOC100836448 isoform X1 [Brachypodium distachyon]|uniref:Zinc finger GRF-type domain-containing protein n=1 Tax=Brachypodium distachyon TaxID=15368 RepID=A0A2K2D8T4_BRADI|nr:uncharacterized protein LOC100836448 isoform X1 [Brachypodium distachyon]PNT70679.1 hypothetical protein BRADI_2g15965v3 [Brachypodium distachyon]|eukprot:XP_024314090.1 uncharacterized protein LOC100836448 isoform X1 [Brachypodium distachyon]
MDFAGSTVDPGPVLPDFRRCAFASPSRGTKSVHQEESYVDALVKASLQLVRKGLPVEVQCHGVRMLLPPRWIHMREFAAGAGENVVCHCLCLVKIRVAYEGTDAGRRLLACGFEDGVKCNFYQWLDPEWPGQMQHVLTKMWEEIDELKQSKRHEMHRLNQRNSVMHEQVRLAMQELEQEKKKAEEEKKMVEEEKK